MFNPQKSSARRLAIRENRPDTSAIWLKELQGTGTFPSLGIAAGFWIIASLILMFRQEVLPYRPGQSLRYDLMSRVNFDFPDSGFRAQLQQEAREACLPVYRSAFDPAKPDIWDTLQDQLLALPDRVGRLSLSQLPDDLREHLTTASLTMLQMDQTRPAKKAYEDNVKSYIADLRKANWVILNNDERNSARGRITLVPGNVIQEVASTFSYPPDEDLKARVRVLVQNDFLRPLHAKVEALTVASLVPTYKYDPDQTVVQANTAADRVPSSAWLIHYSEHQPIVHKGPIDERSWQVLQAENRAFLATIDSASGWKTKAGLAGIMLILTIALSAYVAHFQPKVIANQMRGIALAGLLLVMLLVAELAGLGTGPIYLLGIAPTLLTGMILSIAYDQRFAVGIATTHAIMVTVGLDQRIGFLVIAWIGLLTACFLLGDIRSRSKLIEVGGVSAIVMMAASAAWGLVSLDPWPYILNNSLFVGAAGLSAGFVVLGTLPFIEKAFRITTGMTLLELADASHPLLQRLALEAPGTYQHSFQVAILAEAAAESINANSLLCRVSAYYHDVGKINKPDYFVENQQAGQQNRHLNLTPSVSFLIIKGHVMDGMEMAREYALPTSLFPFIQQHHGTTLVEYFYHTAKQQHEQNHDSSEVSESKFRYPGPKPRTREVGILMLADAVESATRSMKEPTAARIEELVHELTMKRLLDGQFDDCELTLRDLDRIEKSFTKTLLSIYHGRLSYPSTAKFTATPVANPPQMKLTNDKLADGTA